jgi:arsenite-transporting ATPase
MPDTFRWYAGHLSRYRTGVMKALRPFASRFLNAPVEILDALEKLDAATAELRTTLSDPEISSYRVVLQPEKMVMREAERAISYLGLFNYPVDSIIINRILPENLGEGSFYQNRREIQARYLEMIEANFTPLPLWRAPYYDHEVVGVEALAQLAADCFGDADPGQVFYQGKLQEIEELSDGSCIMRLSMPFVIGSEVKLRKRGDEMFITIGNFKREMILPTVLAKRRAGGGSLQNGVLEITFLPSEPEAKEMVNG